MSFSCPILTPINLYHSSPRFLTTIQFSWNTQPHVRQSIEAQRTSWGQGCSPTFVVNSLPLRSNSAPIRVTPLSLRTSLTLWLGKMAKSLFIHLFFSELTTQEEVWESVTSQVSWSHDRKSQSDVTWCHMMSVGKQCTDHVVVVSQTSFGHISINSPSILTVPMATESPWKDLSIGTSHVSRQSVMAEILGRSTGNHYGTVY